MVRAKLSNRIRNTHCNGDEMTEFKELTGQEGLDKIGGLIEDIRFAMLTTVSKDGSFDSRPMATQKTKFDGTVWFLTAHDSRKVVEISDNSHVTLVYADPSNAKYVSVRSEERRVGKECRS